MNYSNSAHSPELANAVEWAFRRDRMATCWRVLVAVVQALGRRPGQGGVVDYSSASAPRELASDDPTDVRDAPDHRGFLLMERAEMSQSSLELGEVVHVEVRDSAGAVTDYTHEYPIDASGLLRIPSLSQIIAHGMALTPDLRDTISDHFVSDGIFSVVTVNVTLTSTRIDFDTEIAPGETLFIRILNSDGSADQSSGAFPVDGAGIVHIPFLGGTLVRHHRLFEAEHQIEVGLEEGGFFSQPFVVNVTRVNLA